MRSTLLSRNTSINSSTAAAPSSQTIPTIRLISATPSAAGLSSTEGSTSFASEANITTNSSWTSIHPPLPRSRTSLLPKSSTSSFQGAKKRLVPKKSKLSLLGLGSSNANGSSVSLVSPINPTDLSDVVRRIDADGSTKVNTHAGIEIYVDPTDDPELGDILVVKKKKSRAGLDGVRWSGSIRGLSPLGEVDVNANAGKTKEKEPTERRTEEAGKEKWWSIGRGRKDSKDKEKAKESKEGKDKNQTKSAMTRVQKENANPARFNSISGPIGVVRHSNAHSPGPSSLDPPERSRFNSLDSSVLLSSKPPLSISSDINPSSTTASTRTAFTPSPVPQYLTETSTTYSRSGTPTAGGLLAPPPSHLHPPHAAHTSSNTNGQGSIALRAIRSVRSLARIGSWAQLRNGSGPGEVMGSVSSEQGTATVGKAEGKKEKKPKDGEAKKEKKPSVKKKKESKEKSQALRISTSSFEIGALSPAKPSRRDSDSSQGASGQVKTLGKKRSTLLGLGLPSTMTTRLPTVRSGSNASSILVNSNMGANKLSALRSVGSTVNLGRDRAGSGASSLRPLSTSSGCTGVSKASSGSCSSVRWDEEALEKRRREREKEREAVRQLTEQDEAEMAEMAEKSKDKKKKKGKSKEGKAAKERDSRRSSEGRRRTPLSEVFPDAVELTPPKECPIHEELGNECVEEPVHASESSRSHLHKQSRGFSEHRNSNPVPVWRLNVEEATSDGHGCIEEKLDDENEMREQDNSMTPTKKLSVRRRPMSEQLLGSMRTYGRPKGMYIGTDDGSDGVLSILDAATNDLAQLIQNLDLEATPGTPDLSPLRLSPSVSQNNSPSNDSPKLSSKGKPSLQDSPLKGLRASMASISSLRPYAQSRNQEKQAQANTDKPRLIGQQIAPWPVLSESVATDSLAPAATITPSRLKHKRQQICSPAPPAEPSPVFQPLKPAKSKGGLMAAFVLDSSSPTKKNSEHGVPRAPSSLTFGSHSRSSSAKSGLALDETHASSSPAPVFKKSHTQKKSSLSSSISLANNGNLSDSMPFPPETKRILGMTGTMGGSAASGYAEPELDASDPDSDIPDELQILLASQSDLDDTMEFPRTVTSTGSPHMDLSVTKPAKNDCPVFRAQVIDDDDNRADIDAGSSSDDDTKKSFDFTGELKQLNESGESDRRSFVEQLENAFRTPAKIDLRYDFGSNLLRVEVPPVPELPKLYGSSSEDPSSSSSGLSLDSYPSDRLMEVKEPTFLHLQTAPDSLGNLDLQSEEQIVDVKEPTLLPGSDSLATAQSVEDISLVEGNDLEHQQSAPLLRNTSSMGSRPSDGQLNIEFKFGGRPRPPTEPIAERPLTLSDIIPPPALQRALSQSSLLDEDDSVLKSIFAKASDIANSIVPPVPRPRVDSDSSSKRRAREISRTSAVGVYNKSHSRSSSGISFTGFESFEEVRRGFEFSGPRPQWYPSASTRRGIHAKHESVISIASVSSYGHVINPGSNDPFDYGLPSLQERPSSEDLSISISMTVDDTFSFIGRRRRRRVDSDASSFYFKSEVSHIQPYNRRHRRHESNLSVSSLAPPVSLYNRSFGVHRRNDSSTSVSSVAHSYAMFGANGGRAAWARHRQGASVDSTMSDVSMSRLGRPGLGDKMFETAVEQGMPLTSISASPPDGAGAGAETEPFSSHLDNRPSFDSIMDDDGRSSIDDSLFDKTGHRTSVSSESVFGYDGSLHMQGHLLPPNQFRPLSMISINSSHSPMKEDDTMITMLDGGHVRRRSVGSIIDASPCIRFDKKKHGVLPFNEFADNYDSPNKARIIEKPSIASTSSSHFGGERMIRAKRGLLERQSLEESCLIADGEDMSISLNTIPVFSRPGPASRSRSSTCTSSSGADTPPLSASDGSSVSSGSQSSIDLAQLNIVLSNATHPVTTIARARARARARGQGHRRRISEARISRSSVYETIEEEMSANSSPVKSTMESKKDDPTICGPVYVVDPDMAYLDSSPGSSVWDDERGIMALRRYYALRDEAQVTVTESKRTWVDTPFSIFALQSFQPPDHPEGMQALLQHSVQNFGPLPSELRPRRMRSRTHSRASPYPQARMVKVSISPEQTGADQQRPFAKDMTMPAALRPVPFNSNIDAAFSPAPVLDKLKPSTVDLPELKRENAWGLAPHARPRVGSAARRNALGWTKRSTGAKSSTDQKENMAGNGSVTMTPGESLRLSRPRPRGRPTPARTQIRA